MPMIVSKSLPRVEKDTIIFAGAVQVYQTEAPPSLPAIVGSPVSLVASRLLPTREPLTPTATWALPKLSLGGWAAEAIVPYKTQATAAKPVAMRSGERKRL